MTPAITFVEPRGTSAENPDRPGAPPVKPKALP